MGKRNISIHIYNYLQFVPLQSFLYQCIGVTLQQCFNKEVVKKQLQEILLTARHNDAIEREVPETQMSNGDFSDFQKTPLSDYCSTPGNHWSLTYVAVVCTYQGVAMSVGLCANSHLEGTLAKLDEFGKSDAFKKSPSIFNLLKVQGHYFFTWFLSDRLCQYLILKSLCCFVSSPLRSVMMLRWRR